MTEQPESPKDVALQAVGRAVVNFQRLEHNLKVAARFGPIDGPLSKALKDIEKRAEKSKSLTLGQAIQAWLTAVGSDHAPEAYTPDLFEPTVSFRFRLIEAGDAQQSSGEILKGLLEFRNKLIHGGLVHFPWDSKQDCAQLTRNIAEVIPIIGAQIDSIASVLQTFQGITERDIEFYDGTEPWEI